jgi:membrane fusion protein, adhesin transport system
MFKKKASPSAAPGSIRHALQSAFREEAQEAITEQAPSGGRKIIWLALACVTALVVWASLTHIDEVVRGEGKVIPSQSVQVVQSLDGGVMAELLTREGASVQKDQPLMRIETVRADAQQGEARSRSESLQARQIRLSAEALGLDTMARIEGPSAVVLREQALFAARRSELQATLRVIDEQIIQRQQEAREAQARRDASQTSLTLISKELAVTKPLLASGAVSEIEVLRLERDVARTQGEINTALSQIDRVAAAVTEARQRRAEVQEVFRSKARSELNEVGNELGALAENLKALDDRVTKTVLKAPTAGVIKTVHVKTQGSVVSPGKDVIEIVPGDDSLLIEARVSPRDIAGLHLGQSATVRFSAYDFAVHGSLQGKVEHIGADTVTDERNNTFYIVRVRSAKPAQDAGDAIGSKARPIIPGMTVTVDVLNGKRTVLTYLTKPLVRAKEKAFTER